MNDWLSFLSTLIWQLIFISVLFAFRRQFSALIERLATIKHGGTELTFQSPSEEASSPGEAAEEELEILDPRGFLTNEGVRKLIADSQFVENSESVKNPYLIFETSRQRTWLVPTDLRLICVLDDEGTRLNRRLIQWHIPLGAAQPVTTDPYKANSGLLHIGKKRNWIYSKSLHPSSMQLEREVRDMIASARAS